MQVKETLKPESSCSPGFGGRQVLLDSRCSHQPPPGRRPSWLSQAGPVYHEGHRNAHPGVPSYVHLPPCSATGTAHTQSRHWASREGVNQILPLLRHLESSCGQRADNTLCLGHDEHGQSRTAQAGTRVRLPAPHACSMCWHMPRSHISPAPRCHISPAPRCHHYPSPRLARGCHRDHVALIFSPFLCHLAVVTPDPWFA